MYETIRARDIKPGFVIMRYGADYYVLRTEPLKDTIRFIAKPWDSQTPRPFILEMDQPLFSLGLVSYKHSHYWS